MERCAELIEKLNEDFKNNASVEQLLITLHHLQKELSLKVTSPPFKRTGKVSVVMPNSFQTTIFENFIKSNETIIIEDEVTQSNETTVNIEETTTILNTIEPTNTELEDAYDEIPTVIQQRVSFELNDTIINEKLELNEKLLTSNVVLADVLTESPIKDLKKGIALNDKFVFINELFRGDESMYERSIKTINDFAIYPEAQYWIERELKTKIGWDPKNETVEHFYTLVKRRFI